MDLTVFIILGLSVMVVLFIVLTVRARKVHQRNRQIAESLDTIRIAADKSRIKGIEVPEIDITPAFTTLRTLAEDCPDNVLGTLQDMEDRWQEVSRRVSEYNAQDTVSTLQSSLALSKTDELVRQIHELATEVERQLGAPQSEGNK